MKSTTRGSSPFWVIVTFLSVLILLSLAGCGSSNSTPPTPSVPVFSSAPPTAAEEGSAFTYTLAATDPSGGSVSFALTTGPDGASISGTTVSWTPTHAQSRTDNAFTITATTTEGATARQNFSVNPNGTIHGTVIDHGITGNGLANYAEDLTNTSVEALVPATGGGYTSVAGSGDASGNITIANVPSGGFWLHIGRLLNGMPNDSYYWTSASDVDLGGLMQGRGDAAPSTLGMNISTNIALGSTITSGDTVSWTSPDAGAGGYNYPPVLQQNYVATFPQWGNLIDRSKGDRAFFIHYGNNGEGLSTIKDFATFNITETDGVVQALSGSTSQITPQLTGPILAISQFDPLVDAPNLLMLQRTFLLEDATYNGSEGYAFGIPLVIADFNSASDANLGTVTYGMVSPNDAVYTFFGEYGYRPTAMPNMTFNFQQGAEVFSNVVPQATTPIVPVLGMPASPTIDGKDIFSPQTVSTAPTVAWTAPTLGTPAFYQLDLWDLSDFSSSTGSMPYWQFETSGTSIKIPAGLMASGKTYAFILAAAADSATQANTAPMRHGTVYAASFVASSGMTVGSAGSARQLNRSTSTKASVRIVRGLDGRFRVQK